MLTCLLDKQVGQRDQHWDVRYSVNRREHRVEDDALRQRKQFDAVVSRIRRRTRTADFFDDLDRRSIIPAGILPSSEPIAIKYRRHSDRPIVVIARPDRRKVVVTPTRRLGVKRTLPRPP